MVKFSNRVLVLHVHPIKNLSKKSASYVVQSKWSFNNADKVFIFTFYETISLRVVVR